MPRLQVHNIQMAQHREYYDAAPKIPYKGNPQKRSFRPGDLVLCQPQFVPQDAIAAGIIKEMIDIVAVVGFPTRNGKTIITRPVIVNYLLHSNGDELRSLGRQQLTKSHLHVSKPVKQ